MGLGKGSSNVFIFQIAVAVAEGDGGLENSGDMLASTPKEQVHSFADPISAMGKAVQII